MVDLGVLSRFDPDPDEELIVADELRMCSEELNSLGCPVTVLDGNHEARWRKALMRNIAPNMRGCFGLSFAEQMYAQGLRDNIKFVFESSECFGLCLGSGDGRVLIRHGDHQFPMGPRHVAAAMLARTPSINQVIGHVHRSQMAAYTSLGKTYWAVANPTMQKPQEFAKDPNWQLGFTLVHFWGGNSLDTCTKSMPQIILANNDGSFVYEGKVYA